MSQEHLAWEAEIDREVPRGSSTLFRFLPVFESLLLTKSPPVMFESGQLVLEVLPIDCRHLGLSCFFDQVLEIMERRNRCSAAVVDQRDVFAGNAQQDGSLSVLQSCATPVPDAG